MKRVSPVWPKAVNDLAERARINKLKPDEITGGTFTITNFGSYHNLAGTPIINQPQAAILGTGVVRKTPVVIETNGRRCYSNKTDNDSFSQL